jgi:DNA-3-methyladenine glycosylase
VDWSARFERPLPRATYGRPTEAVARDLLGAHAVRRTSGGWRAVRLVETEAYVANDPANHAFRGRTERNRSMFAGPGTLYVYRIHQVHCANIATQPGEAVLLRAGEPTAANVGDPSGPGRLCRALGLTRADDGRDVVGSDEFRLVPGPTPTEPIAVGPRIGIRLASERPLRFYLSGNPWVSMYRAWSARTRRPRAFP